MLHETLRPPRLVPMHQSVDGVGLTTLSALNLDEILGVSHIEDERFQDGYIRTYLGALINHAEPEDANCRYTVFGEPGERILYLTANEIVYPGQELLIPYGFIKPLVEMEVA